MAPSRSGVQSLNGTGACEGLRTGQDTALLGGACFPSRPEEGPLSLGPGRGSFPSLSCTEGLHAAE